MMATKSTAPGNACSDPIKLDQTVVAFIATAVFIMLRHNVIDNSQD